MINIRNIIRKLIISEYNNIHIIEDIIEDNFGKDVGKIFGSVCYKAQELISWMEEQKIDLQTQKYILSITKLPIAILKNIYVYEGHKNQGYGKDGMELFLDESYQSDYVILIVDNTSHNEFPLEKWYEKYGFKTIGQVDGKPIMLMHRI